MGSPSKCLYSPQPTSFSPCPYWSGHLTSCHWPCHLLCSCLTHQPPGAINIEGGWPCGRSSHAHYLIFMVLNISILIRGNKKPGSVRAKLKVTQTEVAGMKWNPRTSDYRSWRSYWHSPMSPHQLSQWLSLTLYLLWQAFSMARVTFSVLRAEYFLMFSALRHVFHLTDPFPTSMVGPWPYYLPNHPHTSSSPIINNVQASLSPLASQVHRPSLQLLGWKSFLFSHPLVLAVQIPSSKFPALEISK